MSGNHPALGSFSEKSPTQQPAQPCSPSFFQATDRAEGPHQTTTTFTQPTQPTSQLFGQPLIPARPVGSSGDAPVQKLTSGFISYTPVPVRDKSSKTSSSSGFGYISAPIPRCKSSLSPTRLPVVILILILYIMTDDFTWSIHLECFEPIPDQDPCKAFGDNAPPYGKSYQGPGTAIFVFTPFAERDLVTGEMNFFQSLTRMPHFMDFSFEELRLQDYCHNRTSHKELYNFFGGPTTKSLNTIEQTASPPVSVQQNQKSPFTPFTPRSPPKNNLFATQGVEPTNKVDNTASLGHNSGVPDQPPPAQRAINDVQELQKQIKYEFQGLQLEQAQQKLRQIQMEIQIQEILQQYKQQLSTAGIGMVPAKTCSCGGAISKSYTSSADLAATSTGDAKEKLTLDPSPSVSGGLFSAPLSPQQGSNNIKASNAGYTLLNDRYSKSKTPAFLQQHQLSTNSTIERETRDHASTSDIELAVRDGYYCSPPLDVLERLTLHQLEQVGGFVVGRLGYGKVEFIEPVDLSKMPLDMILSSLVRFGYKTVTIYPDIKTKPHRGQGLNVPAKVTLEQCYTLDKATQSRIVDPSHPRFTRFLAKLKSRPGTVFVEYEIANGAWVFLVDSF